ncbi:DUF2306 domain-containing protein [Deminuibacter soli]|uniref:DUF2306 domain-containing protein n=2 Tax=Deminuibacter soli TaxID=2291815 RepID=A0A3E1NKB8_9BACT|nr:DUF2306 domain-containing protein [Deminuibacter soli]
MLLLTLPYTSFDRYTGFLQTKIAVYHLLHWRVSFYVHVFVSMLVLVSGLLQFNRTLLRKYPRWHRLAGKLYVLVVLLLSGPAGLVMAFYANGGWPARTGFVLLALSWLTTTALAWRYALQRKWQLHGNMMTRSYALTLSALTLRGMIYCIAVLRINISPVAAYVFVAWASWVLNWLIAEWMIKTRGE